MLHYNSGNQQPGLAEPKNFKEGSNMFLGTVEQTDKVFGMMWKNWEDGWQKVFDSQQAFGKSSLEALDKQQKAVHAMFKNLKDMEKEVTNSFNDLTKAVKENSKNVKGEEAGRLFDSWNEKMAEIIQRLQQLAATPSKATLTMVEQSQQKMYESFKKVAEEQTKLQVETKARVDDFMAQIKESQQSFLKLLEEQAKQTLENSKSV